MTALINSFDHESSSPAAALLQLEWCASDGVIHHLATFASWAAACFGCTNVAGLSLQWSVEHRDGRVHFSAEAAVEAGVRCGFFQLRWCAPGTRQWCFNGIVSGHTCFRQSPRNPSIHVMRFPIQAAPLAAVEFADGCYVVCGHSPERDDNASTQVFDPAQGTCCIAGGDLGVNTASEQGQYFAPAYAQILPENPRRFEAVLFRCVPDERAIRNAVYQAVASAWGSPRNGFADLCFSMNHLLLRRNETGASRRWVAAGIVYANKQYARDGFWQAWVLNREDDLECYRALTADRLTTAENPLIKIIWAFRLHQRGVKIEVDDHLRAAIALMRSGLDETGAFRSRSGTGHGDFRSWYDLCAFTDDDVITYNQGLAAVAIRAVTELAPSFAKGLNLDAAVSTYRGLYDPGLLAFSLSRNKRAFAVDALCGDLLSWCLWGEPLLGRTAVAAHYRLLDGAARTQHGYRVTCAADGSILPGSFYSIPGYRSKCESAEPGSYQRGGSWLLYDLICLLSCCAHKIDGAEAAVVWRLSLDLERSATLNEHLHTESGVPCKPNQGWNGMIIPAWDRLTELGRVRPDRLDFLSQLCTAPLFV